MVVLNIDTSLGLETSSNWFAVHAVAQFHPAVLTCLACAVGTPDTVSRIFIAVLKIDTSLGLETLGGFHGCPHPQHQLGAGDSW